MSNRKRRIFFTNEGAYGIDNKPVEGAEESLVTSGGIFAAIQQMAQETEEATKQAVNEDLEARKFKVIAKALCELKATLDVVVEAVTSENIGTRTADSLDVQELLIGGTVFDPSELNNTKSLSLSVPNSDIRKSISESSDELEVTEETETETKEVFGKTSADKNEK
jgi:hypothetical protein